MAVMFQISYGGNPVLEIVRLPETLPGEPGVEIITIISTPAFQKLSRESLGWILLP